MALRDCRRRGILVMVPHESDNYVSTSKQVCTELCKVGLLHHERDLIYVLTSAGHEYIKGLS